MSDNTVDYNEYTRLVNSVLILQVSMPDEKRWRRGQAYFNVLDDVRPDLADQVRAMALDPFHNDDKVPQFLAWVCLHWGYESELEAEGEDCE